MPKKYNTKEIILKAQSVHGDKYYYSKVKYVGITEEITITCKVHGDFNQKPTYHIGGSTCPKCARMETGSKNKVTLTTEDFIAKAIAVHGNVYLYSKTVVSHETPHVEIICKLHGLFTQRKNDHLNGSGCPECSGTRSKETFIEKAKILHGSKYDYSKVIWVGATTPVEILCRKHGAFWSKPSGHLNVKTGCFKCSNNSNITTEEFICKAKNKHGDTYLYGNTAYHSRRFKVIITCKIHGDFKQRPTDHLIGRGCSRCVDRRYSKIAIRWIEQYAYSHRLKNVQHAENGGEYCIPGTRFFVDGFHERSNTVFEFHGSLWHGDPKVYKPRSKPNHFSNKTAKRLYMDTLAREEHIRSLGYNLIVMWESDYGKQTIPKVS